MEKYLIVIAVTLFYVVVILPSSVLIAIGVILYELFRQCKSLIEYLLKHEE